MTMDKSTLNCPHEDFKMQANVSRLLDDHTRVFTGRLYVEVTGECLACGAHISFQGMPGGLDPSQPSISVDGREARLPATILLTGWIPALQEGR